MNILLVLLTGALITCFLAWIFQATKMEDGPRKRILVGISLEKEIFTHTNQKWTVANMTTFVGVIAASWLLFDTLWFQTLPGKEKIYLLFLILASDILDGFFARSLKQCSDLGRKIDPGRDREAALAILVLLFQCQAIVAVLAGGVLLAEILIGVLAYIADRQKKTLTVHTVGKCRMAVHIAAGATFIAFPEAAFPAVLVMFLASISALVAYAKSYWKLAHSCPFPIV
ncbi:MAG: CDP-alcohol phosphatidyltransferase family protein [Candidatus Moraniibacteriota bacterium]